MSSITANRLMVLQMVTYPMRTAKKRQLRIVITQQADADDLPKVV